MRGQAVKIPKDIRSRLHTTRHAIAFRWPSTKVEPQPGSTYVVESDAGDTGHHILVVAAIAVPDGWDVTARLAQDKVRLLGKAGGYTDFEGRAMRDGTVPEPEAVDPDAQDTITRRAQGTAALAEGDLAAMLDEVLGKLRNEVEKHPRARLIKNELWQARGRLEAARRKVAHSGAARAA